MKTDLIHSDDHIHLAVVSPGVSATLLSAWRTKVLRSLTSISQTRITPTYATEECDVAKELSLVRPG